MPVTTDTTDCGFRAVFADPVTVADIQDWVDDVRQAVQDRDRFGQWADIRSLPIPVRDAQVAHALREAMLLFQRWGLHRSAVIVPDMIAGRRVMRAAQRWSPDTQVRVIDAREPGWEKAARAWIVHGIEPYDTLASPYVTFAQPTTP